MAKDNGLLVARYNTAPGSIPSLATDDTLRELRIDEAGRLLTRATDGNDNTISYLADGDAVNNGVGDTSGGANDRGVLVFGINDVDGNYQAIRVNPDGSLVISTQSGTDVSEHSNAENGAWSATDTNGEISLTKDNWVLVHAVPVPASSTANITGFSYASDANTIFQLCYVNDSLADGVTRSDVDEALDTQVTSSARPSDHVTFSRSKERPGGANIYVAIFAKQLQAGVNAVAWGSIDMHTIP